MALSNLSGWNKNEDSQASAACGSACGAEKTEKEPSSACGAEKTEKEPSSACGAGKPEEKPSACGSACGASK